MIRKLILAILFAVGLTAPALAQNTQCSDRPPGDSSNACANTRFVHGAVPSLPVPVPQGGTGQTSFTSNLPLIGNGAGPIAQGTRSGTTTSFATTIGSPVTGNCAQWDANGNLGSTSCGTTTIPDQTFLGNNSGSTGAATGLTMPQAKQMLGGLIDVTAAPYNAKGDSNGTHGSGTDNQAAFQAAMNAGGMIYVPCGIYRIVPSGTSGISITGSLNYRIHGNGTCSQIFLDNTASASFLNFNPSSCSAPYCLTIDNLYFSTPNAASTAEFLTINHGWSPMLIYNNVIWGYQYGIDLVNTYASIIESNMFHSMGNWSIRCNADASCNNTKIWNNSFINGGATDVIVGTAATTDCNFAPNNVSFIGNDFEGNVTGGSILFQGACAVTLQDNYFEGNSFSWIYFGNPGQGVNQGYTIQGNWINANGNFSFQNVTGINFLNNTWVNQNLTYGTGVSAVTWGFQSLIGTSSLEAYCSPTQNCSYMQNGNMVQWGTATTSSGTPGSVAVTFPVACPTTFISASTSTANGSSAGYTSYGAASVTGMTIYSNVGPATVTWNAICR